MTTSPDISTRTGILLVNLGTPDAPTPQALRRYLKEFLSDPRVVELPRWLWWPILNGIILNTRPKKSAAKYASIWMPQGSPLRVYTERLTDLLRERLTGSADGDLSVAYAMRYGTPSIPEVMRKLQAQGCQRILVVPLYPQYSASTTATVTDVICAEMQTLRDTPAIRTIKDWHTHPGYIDALANSIEEAWARDGKPDMLVMSFHGLPQKSIDLGDPYQQQCLQSGTLLAARLKLSADQYRITFQSRFGRAAWLQPYTSETLTELGRQGTSRVDVVCPGFVADCLETLEEIAQEGKEEFLHAGGKEYRYLPCLNERADWVQTLESIVRNNLGGWLE